MPMPDREQREKMAIEKSKLDALNRIVRNLEELNQSITELCEFLTEES